MFLVCFNVINAILLYVLFLIYVNLFILQADQAPVEVLGQPAANV